MTAPVATNDTRLVAKYGYTMSSSPAAICGHRSCFLPYTNRTNPMPLGDERHEQLRRVERQPVELGRRHRKSSIEIVRLPVLPSSDDPDLRTDMSARSTAVSLRQRPLSRHRSVLEHPATSVQQQSCVAAHSDQETRRRARRRGEEYPSPLNLQILTKRVNSMAERLL